MHTIVRLLALAANMALATAVSADTIVIDDTTAGAVYDGILDGFPLPPPGTTPDGIGDFTGNALGVCLQSGVTEERGIAELPLAPLAGLTAADIASATLTFTIDDVVGTFGPGTTFDGTAASTIILFSYSGDGTITTGDFGNVVGAPLEVVSTTSFGTITDASLASSGALAFTVDATAELQALLSANATHMGFVFVTNDAGSCTSLDNLGVAGARMPFLTIETVPNDPPAWDSDQLNCQKALASAAKLSQTVHQNLSKCLASVLSAASKGEQFTKVAAKCSAALDPADPGSKVGKAIAKLQARIADKCRAPLTPADVGNPCNASATTFADTTTCIVAQHLSAASAGVAAAYAPACALISAVALDDEYPALCD